MPCSGLELPIFSADEPILTKAQLRDASQLTDADYFLRVCDTAGLTLDTLTQRLEMAHLCFKRIESECRGVHVVNYSYGFYPDDPSIDCDRSAQGNIIPRGLLLAARVATIDPVPRIEPDTELHELFKTFAEFRSKYSPRQWFVEDVGSHQTMYGIARNYGNHEPGHRSIAREYYIDIEPRFPQTQQLP